jgi:SAM-dependent methyltransferase
MNEPDLTPDATRTAVRDRYGEIARTSGSCCAPGCCGAPTSTDLGYSEADLAVIPKGADLALGCGNPTAIASLRPGETVLDLGSGAGMDAFLASDKVGATGKVIGVDMTADMIARARANAREVGAVNVEFRLGEIEHLPVADDTVDVVLSNCVVNLSPEKKQVFAETFRVLRSGGRVAIADIVATAELPPSAKQDLQALTGCVAGAALIDDLERWLGEVGFVDVRITPKDGSRELVRQWTDAGTLADYVLSAVIEARKP